MEGFAGSLDVGEELELLVDRQAKKSGDPQCIAPGRGTAVLVATSLTFRVDLISGPTLSFATTAPPCNKHLLTEARLFCIL
jgi:hypothetical protein